MSIRGGGGRAFLQARFNLQCVPQNINHLRPETTRKSSFISDDQ